MGFLVLAEGEPVLLNILDSVQHCSLSKAKYSSLKLHGFKSYLALFA